MSDFDARAREIVHDMLDSDIEDCHCEGVKIMTMQMADRISAALKEAYDAGRKSEEAMWELQRLSQEMDLDP